MPPFQASVAAQMPFGVVGELHNDSPHRAQPVWLQSDDPTENVIGRGLVVVSGATGSWAAGSAGGLDPKPMIAGVTGLTGVFAGILANPKEYAGYGGAAGPLSPTLYLPNGTLATAVTEGDITVSMPTASAPGDPVYVLFADGTLVRTAPGAAAPANSIGPIGTIQRYTNAAASLAVLHVEPIVPPPA